MSKLGLRSPDSSDPMYAERCRRDERAPPATTPAPVGGREHDHRTVAAGVSSPSRFRPRVHLMVWTNWGRRNRGNIPRIARPEVELRKVTSSLWLPRATSPRVRRLTRRSVTYFLRHSRPGPPSSPITSHTCATLTSSLTPCMGRLTGMPISGIVCIGPWRRVLGGRCRVRESPRAEAKSGRCPLSRCGTFAKGRWH